MIRIPPAKSVRSASVAFATSALLPRLRGACQDVQRFIFCATTGRSGTKTLSAVLAGGEDAVSFHEPFPAMNSHVLTAAAAGRHRAVRLAWNRLKLPTVFRDARGHRVYAETNHQFVKVFADLAYEEFGSRLAVVYLVRDSLAVAQSMYEVGQVPGSSAGERWLLDPEAPTNLVPFSIAAEAGLTHPLHRCLWYCLETEARTRAARRKLTAASWIDMDVEELNSQEGLTRLDQALDLRLSPESFELAGQRLNTKPKKSRAERRLSPDLAADLHRQFRDAYADWSVAQAA